MIDDVETGGHDMSVSHFGPHFCTLAFDIYVLDRCISTNFSKPHLARTRAVEVCVTAMG